MRVKCEGCDGWHVISPTAMAIVIQALQNGDLQLVTGEGVIPLCFKDAFTPDTLKAWRNKLSTKGAITFDTTHWSKQEEAAA